MRRALLLAVAALALSGCSDEGIDHTKLEHALGATFRNLYALQQSEVGHPASTPVQSTSCAKGGSPDGRGAGDDWTCVVLLYPPDGTVVNAPYDVTVKADGCFTATGPPTVVGQQTLQDTHGHTVTNPLFQFDGCFALD